MVRDGVSKEVVFEGTLEKGERSLLGIQGKRIQGRENSKCKGPEGGTSLVSLRSSKEAGIAGEE